MRRADNLDYLGSLRRAMEGTDPAEIQMTARRQKHTVDALLSRLYNEDPTRRRELVLLADEVGLGKTFVALGVAWSVLVQREAAGLPARPVLIVTPGSPALYEKWQREAETFFKDVVHVAPRMVAVETPQDLVNSLRSHHSKLVIARMSAFSGRLSGYDGALAAVLHTLFREMATPLSVDQRLELVAGWPCMDSREAVSLKSSSRYLFEAQSDARVSFSESQIRAALRRLSHVDHKVIDRLQQTFELVAHGEKRLSDFFRDLRELARAALGQRVNGAIPLVIVDEIHNWKNHPQSWHRFMHTLGGRIERMLGVSATPFQLGPHELAQVLALRRCLLLDTERANVLEACATQLTSHMDEAQEAGKRLRQAWAEVNHKDLPELRAAWRSHHASKSSNYPLPPHLTIVLDTVKAVESAHGRLTSSLRPFLIRHRRNLSYRRWWVGRYADSSAAQVSMQGSSLQWQPGLDVVGDGELLHYLMMRVTQEQKHGRGAVDLGADLGGSYTFFRENRLRRLQDACLPSARPYLALVDQATRPGLGHEHPKVKVTATRAFDAWLRGDKTLVFCFNPKTVDTIHEAIGQRIADYEAQTLTKAFNCSKQELPKRLENFQKRLYTYRQSVFLLFQDHPLAGMHGHVPANLAMRSVDLENVAETLAASGAPMDRSRFDRRRVIAAVEQALITRWQTTDHGMRWLDDVLGAWRVQPSALQASHSQGTAASPSTVQQAIDLITAPGWPSHRRSLIEGLQRGAEAEPFPDEEARENISQIGYSKDIAAWKALLDGQAGRAVLAPYLAQRDVPLPSLLTCWHSKALHGLPQPHRALATRMLRRMVRSPGFLARFLLDDPATGSALARDGDESDLQWTTLLHQRWSTPPMGGESARDRFDAYLESLRKVVGTDKNFAAYENASRNREVVARITGGSDARERDRHFVGFNTPLIPEVLIVTSVGQEGIDLHRECRHVVHHDLPWNPAVLEQRTGRVDRIGSKASRMAISDPSQGHLDVVVPYIANTYDEHRFRVVHGRSRLFDATMGGDYGVDEPCRSVDVMEEGKITDDINPEDRGEAVEPLPAEIGDALRIRLEAESNHE